MFIVSPTIKDAVCDKSSRISCCIRKPIYSKDGSIKEYDSVKAYLERDEFVEIDDDVDLPFD